MRWREGEGEDEHNVFWSDLTNVCVHCAWEKVIILVQFLLSSYIKVLQSIYRFSHDSLVKTLVKLEVKTNKFSYISFTIRDKLF